MKSLFIKTTLAFALMFTLGTSAVFAWTEAPAGGFPTGQVPAPVNTGTFDQNKAGGLAAKILKAGIGTQFSDLMTIATALGVEDPENAFSGWSIAESTMLSPHAYLGMLRAGQIPSYPKNGSTLIDVAGMVVDQQRNTGFGLIIDVSGGTGNLARNVLRLAAASIGQDRVTTVMNKPFFQLWDELNSPAHTGGIGGIFQGRTVRLSGDSLNSSRLPARGKILVSGDGLGTAVWGTYNSNAIRPDVIMVKAGADLADDQSKTVTCPANYSAIAVACDSNGEAGVDECSLNAPANVGHTDYVNLGEVSLEFPTSGTVSPVSNNATYTKIWLTCMRSAQFPEELITIPEAPQFDANGNEIVTVVPEQWANGAACTAAESAGSGDPSKLRVHEVPAASSGLGFVDHPSSCMTRTTIREGAESYTSCTVFTAGGENIPLTPLVGTCTDTYEGRNGIAGNPTPYSIQYTQQRLQ